MERSDTYKKRIMAHTKKSNLIKNTALAFIFGGSISAVGELIAALYKYLGASEEDAYTWLTVTLIAVAAILTGIGIFDKIAKHAGAGTLVPVTGFANAVVSPALDTKSEGFILGVGAKIFTVAGPVILYGIISGTVIGIIYYTVSILFGG